MKKKFIIVLSLIVLLMLIGVSSYLLLSPKISLELLGDQLIKIEVSNVYEEPGFDAKINKQDAGSLVEIKGEVDTTTIGEYKIQYIIAKKRKTIMKERTVVVEDRVAPVLTLKGKEEITLYVNSEYEEPGFDVSDNYDKDMNDRVEIKGNIDTKTPGKYELTYIAKDSSNNEVTAKRIINVLEKKLVNTKIPVLMYHFFYEGDEKKDANFTEVHAFEEQVKYLVDNNYYFPTWKEVNDFLDGKILLPEKSIVLTFDDNDPTFHLFAYPVLAKYGVRGTVFAITSWAEVGQNDDVLVFQSHSHNMHRGGCSGQGHGGIFQCIDEESGIKDLKKSMELANGATVFCYPFGDVNDHAVNMLKKAGFQMAFTTEWGKIGPGMDKYRLPRIRISGGISLERFISNIK